MPRLDSEHALMSTVKESLVSACRKPPTVIHLPDSQQTGYTNDKLRQSVCFRTEQQQQDTSAESSWNVSPQQLRPSLSRLWSRQLIVC